MITKVTRGIRVSVKTSFEGTFFKNYKMHFAFGYTITIENQSSDPVQLTSRHWDIYDALTRWKYSTVKALLEKNPLSGPGNPTPIARGVCSPPL